MSITALVTGKLIADPVARASARGKAFATAQVAADANGESLLGHVVAFGSVQEQLLALAKGDAVAIVGRLKPTAWNGREGELRTGFDLVADQILTVYHVRRRRHAMATADAGTPGDAAEPGDAGPQAGGSA